MLLLGDEGALPSASTKRGDDVTDEQVQLNFYDTGIGMQCQIQVYPDEMGTARMIELLEQTLEKLKSGEADIKY